MCTQPVSQMSASGKHPRYKLEGSSSLSNDLDTIHYAEVSAPQPPKGVWQLSWQSGPMTTVNTTSIATQYVVLEGRGDGLPDLDAAQFISGSNIDPSKLTALLRKTFGKGAYNTHVSPAY